MDISRYHVLLKQMLNEKTVDDQNSNSRVLIVDGLNTFIRAYAASPTTNSDGEHIGGISGFLLSIGHAIKAINPTRVIVTFDGKNGSARRRSIYPDYKANRKVKIRLNRSETVDKQDTQLQQLVRLIKYLEIMPVTTIVVDGAEADDVIAYIANDYLLDKESQVFIMSTDKDFMQLVNEQIHVWSPTKKKMFYTSDVIEDFQVPPENFALYRALIGDNSDNIPGAAGLGSATLLERFPKFASEPMNIDEFFIYAKELAIDSKVKIHDKVVASEVDIRLYYEIIQLSISTMSMTNKMKIIGLMETPVSKLGKIKFHTMLVEDKMTSAIKNVDMWLREITQKLDRFTLVDSQ